LSMDPLSHATMMTAVNASLARLRRLDGKGADRTPWPRLQVEAFLDALTGGHSDGGSVVADARTGAGVDTVGRGAGDVRGGAVVGRDADDPDVADDLAGVDPPDGPGDGDHGSGSRGHVCCEREPRVPEVIVLVDAQTLIDGLHERSICETDDGFPIPVSTIRRLACDAEIISTLLGANGAVLDAGRSTRTANRAQRRALRAMHRTCGHPDCQVPFSMCKIHHILWWWRDRGRSDISNMIPLCEKHHHLVHEGGWTLSMTPDRVATWTLPDGDIYWTGTCIDRAPNGVAPPSRTSRTSPITPTGWTSRTPNRATGPP
jgi:hypothetical protein